SGTTNVLIAGGREAAGGRAEQARDIRERLLAKHLEAVGELLPQGEERTALEDYIQHRLQGYERLCLSIETLGEVTMRGNDALASIGEELSSRILAAYLRACGCSAEAVSATRLVRTDDRYGDAIPDMTETRRLCSEQLQPMLAGGVTPIVTGYIGSTAAGTTTTLGRGGSDYTAAILSDCLDADEVWICTDVDGILTADPKFVPHAHVLHELSYREAEELAFFGADVLHPKTVAPLARRGIPLRIMNSLAADHAGTLIVPQPIADRTILPAIISTEGLSMIGVSGNGSGWSLLMASRALRCLAEAGVDVLMFSQSFTERSLSLVVRERDQAHSLRVLCTEFANDLQLHLLAEIGVIEEVATVSVVGSPDAHGNSIASRAFSALGKLGLRVIAVGQAASAYSVSFVIAEADVARVVAHIHTELGL
ncbi:MAG: aspartate kinase, partial [Actinobacteria bacterium]|nr:aspartate kinase [Actinomycetota bacterium]